MRIQSQNIQQVVNFKQSAFTPLIIHHDVPNRIRMLREFYQIQLKVPTNLEVANYQNSMLQQKQQVEQTISLLNQIQLKKDENIHTSSTSQSESKQFSHQQKITQKNIVTLNRSMRLRKKKNIRYEEDSDHEKPSKQIQTCQTKNIIKNFMRSVLNFIRKNKEYSLSLVSHLNLQLQDFSDFLETIQDNISTIHELRYLWTNCKYQTAFRIISCKFLRKHYLKHTFNSRIFNYNIHLKYRKRLLLSLQKPQQFTSLKYQ